MTRLVQRINSKSMSTIEVTESGYDVCITTYNSESVISRALESVFNQSLPPARVFLADDASRDRTRARVAREFGTRVEVLPSWRNRGGPAWGRNRAIQSASSSWIAFLDADDEWAPAKMEAQIACLRETGLQASCTQALAVNEDGSSEILGSGIGLPGGTMALSWFDLHRINLVAASSAVVRTDLIRRVRGFPERQQSIGFEDYICWIKVARLTQWSYLGEPLIKYFRSVTSLSSTQVNTRAVMLDEIAREFRRCGLFL